MRISFEYGRFSNCGAAPGRGRPCETMNPPHGLTGNARSPPRASVLDSGFRRNDGERLTPASLRSDREQHRDGGEDFPSAARRPGIPSFRRRPESGVWFMTAPAGTIPLPRRNRSRICPHLRLWGLPVNARESAARGRRRTHGFRKADDGEGEGVGQGVCRPAPFPRRQFRREGRIAESVIFPSAPDCGFRRRDARAPSAP